MVMSRVKTVAYGVATKVPISSRVSETRSSGGAKKPHEIEGNDKSCMSLMTWCSLVCTT